MTSSRDYHAGDIEDNVTVLEDIEDNETVLEDIEDVWAAVFSDICAWTCSFHRYFIDSLLSLFVSVCVSVNLLVNLLSLHFN